MDEPERPSERLIERRLRNRAMEALLSLSEGDVGVRSVGVGPRGVDLIAPLFHEG